MSVGIRFLWSFTVGEVNLNNPGSNVISVTSTAAGDHDKANLCTTPLRETWRSDDVSTWQEIIIQANDVSVEPDCFAILNHNFTENAIVQLQGSMSSDFTAPAFTIVIPYNEKHMVLQQAIGDNYNYYRFRILDTGNNCGYLEIGRLVGGLSFAMADDEDITDDITISPADMAYRMDTEGFFRAFSERVKVDRVALRFSKLKTFAGQNDNYLNLLEMFKEVGITYPFLTIIDPQDVSFEVVWGNLESIPPRTYGINRYVDMSLSLQEVY